MNIDVKCKNCKKKKKKKKEEKKEFPEKLSSMVKTLVKQHVFGNGKGVDAVQPQAAPKKPAAKAPKGAKGAKGAKSPMAKAAPGGAAGVGANAMGSTGVGMQGMNAMEQAAHAQIYSDDYDEYQDMWRRLLMENNEDLVQFDVMEGNIGYSMWRAEWMNWHDFNDYDANDANDNDALMDYGEYRNFGNFVHYFDTLEVNWNEEDNWSDIDTQNSKSWIQSGDELIPIDMGQKCGHKLPFLNFKLCSQVSDNDISVFFKRVSTELAPDRSAAKMQDENYINNDWYNAYFDDFGAEYEWNEVQTLQDIIEDEFEHSLFRFSNDDDWHEIITSYPASRAQNRRHLLNGERLRQHDDKETEIELFGHLYRLQGVSKCGGDSDSPRFCIGVHLGEPIKLPKALQLPMSKMCNFLYIAKVCLGFDPNRMELKLSIQFQSIHKWKSIAKRVLDVIKHLPHKMKRYTKWASKASAAMDEDENINNEVIDGWYDDKENRKWVISSAKVNGENMYLDDDKIWNTEYVDQDMQIKQSATIMTNKGHEVERKCMHMMGDRLCLCQFLAWIDSSQYHCHPQQASIADGIQNMGAISSANGIDINIDDYIDMYYDEEDLSDRSKYYT